MNQLVVTVNDITQIGRLRTAIRQLKGVEQVAMLHEKNTPRNAVRLGKLHKELSERADSLGILPDGWDGHDSKAIAEHPKIQICDSKG